MVGVINFKSQDETAVENLPQQIKKKFYAVTGVARWEFQTPDGKVPYAGLLVEGPKPLPGGGFQCMADVILTEFPPEGVSPDEVTALNNAITIEFNKRAVIEYDDGSLYRPTGEPIDPTALPSQEPKA